VIQFLIAIFISYLIGCINSSIVVGKLLKAQDIRTLGSGNAGFTNALRTSGKKMALLTFAGDFTKGVVAVWVGIELAAFSCSDYKSFILIKIFSYTAALACVIGHIYPCFFKFKGGKGILTAWATSLLIDWKVFLILISVFLIVFLFSKIISLSSIFAAVSYPMATFFVSHIRSCSFKETLIYTLFTLATGAIVVYKHKSNIYRLLRGEEKKISVNRSELK